MTFQFVVPAARGEPRDYLRRLRPFVADPAWFREAWDAVLAEPDPDGIHPTDVVNLATATAGDDFRDAVLEALKRAGELAADRIATSRAQGTWEGGASNPQSVALLFIDTAIALASTSTGGPS